MLSALISFLGGTAFRMIWGELSSYLNKKQDHRFETERLQLEAAIDQERHARDLERIRLQADLGVREIQIAADNAISKVEVDAWFETVREVGKPTGLKWLDGWNGAVRPLLATLAILAVVAQIVANDFALSEWDQGLISAILGLYVADRSLQKRGK